MKRWLVLCAFLAMMSLTAFFGVNSQIVLPNYEVHPDDLPLLESLKNATYSESPPPNAPLLRPATVKTALTQEELKSLSASLEANRQTITISGPQTAGMEIPFPGGKTLKLPPDIYIEAIVATMTCAPTVKRCPETPYMVLAKRGTDMLIRIEPNGGVYIPTVSTELNEQRIADSLQAFAFLLEAGITPQSD